MRRLSTLASGLTAAALLFPTAVASAAPSAPASATRSAAPTGLAYAGLSTRLSGAANSRYLGSGFSGVVLDERTGSTLWSKNSATTRMPASTQKVMTAFTLLKSTSPDTQLVTRVFRSSAVPTNVYLRGAGDPSLTSAKLKTLADRTAAQLRTQKLTRIRLYADASVFPAPTNATGWKASYITEREVQPVRGLTLAGYRGPNGSVAAAKVFAAHLKKAGVTATVAGGATTPGGAVQVGESWSVPVSSLVATMLSASNNDYAEYLLRIAALESGLHPTWTNSLAHQRAVLAEARIPLRGYVNKDGSGLSRSNRMPVTTLATTVDRMWDDARMRRVAFAWGAMPRSGQTGTLRTRFKAASQRCAVGKVIAKTGTLGDAVALAGIASGTDGRTRVFAFAYNGRAKTSSARSAVDSVATAVVGCR